MKTIDCDTHYWPVDFLDRVNHRDKTLGLNAAELFDVQEAA